jgi:adenosine deaminase
MIDKLIENIPKIELHLHLEGAIPLEALWMIIEKYRDKNTDVNSFDELKRKFEFVNFAHFLKMWGWKNRFLRQYDDFTFIANKVAEDLVKQNIVYAEIFYSPGDFEHHGLEVQELTDSIRKGFESFSNKITINLVADLVRDYGPEKGLIWLEKIKDVKDQGVVGIGLGGSEQEYPPEIYKNVYELARKYEFYTSAHAGEGAGPESIWGVIKALRVDRIGHGTRAIEDPELVNYLKENKIPIELCPISNVRTGIIKELKEHPIQKFMKDGLIVSVNTDDPKMFNTSMKNEYLSLINTFKLQLSDIKKLIENAILSAWCNDDRKVLLRKKLEIYTN